MDVNHSQKIRTLLISVSNDRHLAYGSSQVCALLLKNEDSIQLTGKSTLCLAGKLLQDRRLQVVLLHVNTPDNLPLDLLTDLVNNTQACVVLHLPVVDNELVVAALRAGVRGFILHGCSRDDFAHAIQRIAAGEIWASRKQLSDAFTQALSPHGYAAPHSEQEDLTPREQEIVERLCSGLSNKEIARELHISDKTVKTHLQRIYKKSRVHSRLQLALSS